MKATLEKIKQSRLLQSFLAFYKSAESDVTSIAVAYYLLISIFPILLIAANLLPYFKIDTSQALSFLAQVLPNQFYNTIKEVTENILNTPSSGLLSISILSALWTFSRVLALLQKAFNKAYSVSDHRNVLLSRILGFFVGIGLQLILVLTIFLNFFGKSILNLLSTYLHLDNDVYQILLNVTQPVLILSIIGTLMLLYMTLPNIKISKIRYVLPGTLFVTFVLLLFSNLFGLYVEFSISRMNDLKLVGTVFIFVVMTWFIFISKLLIWGAVLNATYQARMTKEIETRQNPVEKLLSKKDENNQPK